MELMRIDSFLFKMLYTIEAGIVVTQILNLDSLTSLLFILTFPLTVLLWIRSARRTIAVTDIIMGIAAALAVICVFTNAGISGGRISFQYLKKLIMFLMTLLFFQTAHRVRVDQKVVNYLNLVVDLLVLFLILMYFTQTRQMYTMGGRVTSFLTFRFTNPNLTALFLGCMFMLKVHGLFAPAKWYVKLVYWVMLLFLGWFILASRSRNCLLAMVFFSAVCVWIFFTRKRTFTMGKGGATLIALFPGVFAVAYMLLVTSSWVQKLLSFIVSEGKGLDSRVEIWGPALENIMKSPIVGAYYQISNGAGSSQMHNTHLDLAASYGLPVLILVCVLLVAYIHQRGKRYSQKSQYLYILAFCCAILLGLGEAAIFSGGMGIYIFVGSFLLLANREQTEKR